jgi:hypothetical protein
VFPVLQIIDGINAGDVVKAPVGEGQMHRVSATRNSAACLGGLSEMTQQINHPVNEWVAAGWPALAASTITALTP